MKIILAPDSYKGSLSAVSVAKAMATGFERAIPSVNIVKLPLADGGEGTAETLLSSVGGEKIETLTLDPLGRETLGYVALIDNGKTAVVEMAVASGLTLLSEQERNPLITSTYGSGVLVKKALDLGVEKIIVAIGGSATNDAGLGVAIALGAVFKDKNQQILSGIGNDLSQVEYLDLTRLDNRLKKTEVLVLCDVDNPFYGPRGAAIMYGSQKGASIEQISYLDSGLTHLAAIIKRELGLDVQQIAGAGAAGGLGGGLVAFLDAKLIPGIDSILQVVNIDQHLVGATLVVTGEGKTDKQTLNGKAPYGVISRAIEAGVPAIIVSGAIGEGIEQLMKAGASGIFSVQKAPCSNEESMNNAEVLIEEFCFNLGSLLRICIKNLIN